HEYQAGKFLADFGIPVSRGEVVTSAASAGAAFSRVGNPHTVAKVQVLMGGRGKAGGVRPVKTAAEAEAFCAQFLGKPFSTIQSAGESKVVRAIYIAENISIQSEFYLGIVVDRAAGRPVILFSKEGGVEIEEVAQKNPAAIQKIYFYPDRIPTNHLVFNEIKKTVSDEKVAAQIADIVEKLCKLFVQKDASICEINPLVLSNAGKVLALDAKIVFDDNALFRHEDIRVLKDPDEDDARETQAKGFGLSYVSMSGNIGCLVNGAGLAMATMDMIKRAGGEPANFLDVGGGANVDQVREGFKIILQDGRVEAILVNIFGGIMKCDVVAQGVLEASREIKLQVPLVVRLEGTRVEEGRALLKQSDLEIHSCTTIEEAAGTAVQKAKKYRQSHVHSH
ncbi:MAG: succinate--CoA ligase subunit beta, partial [Candidatus Omnitrophica bacterium CG1_02_46_14]